jgi:hypothetical protein
VREQFLVVDESQLPPEAFWHAKQLFRWICLLNSQGGLIMRKFAWTFVLSFSGLWLSCNDTAMACDHCIAKQKAQQQASQGQCRHVGGSMGTGRYEGVGFSTVSADHAISRCCYWGQRTPVGIGVARGHNGWYATVLYR